MHATINSTSSLVIIFHSLSACIFLSFMVYLLREGGVTMFELPITKNSYKLLKTIYKEYLRRINTMSDSDARVFFAIPDFIREQFPKKDYYICINELKENEFVRLYCDGGFMLTNKAILFMENRVKGGFSEISDLISNFF